MNLRSLEQADVKGKRVLVRVDFNVPMDGDSIRDDTRIRSAIPTIDNLINRGASVVLICHLGRPKGQVNPKYSLRKAADHLGTLLNKPVKFVDDVVGPEAIGATSGLKPGEILLLENVRFEAGEEKNDPELARKLADLADLFVNDAFGAAHRAHASTEGVAHLLLSYAGLLMIAEVEALTRLNQVPRGDFLALIGGAKVTDKIAVIEKLVPKVETLAIGGGMANTFLLEQGLEIGKSLAEPDALSEARAIRELAESSGTRLLLPTDVVIAESIDATGTRTVAVENVPAEMSIFDIGPDSVRAFSKAAHSAKTIFWNGPMGVFEKDQFANGTLSVAKAVGASDAYSLVGGGDSVAAVEAAGVAEQISHISTGGGASLEFVEGRTLPGLAVLVDDPK